MNAQDARETVARDHAAERENLATRSAYAQSLPLGGTPTLLQLSALDEIARVAVETYARTTCVPIFATGRLFLLGGTLRFGSVETSLYFEVEVSQSYGDVSEASQHWIDASGHYAFESPDAYLYEDDSDNDDYDAL